VLPLVVPPSRPLLVLQSSSNNEKMTHLYAHQTPNVFEE
jgi:hypothetical protein